MNEKVIINFALGLYRPGAFYLGGENGKTKENQQQGLDILHQSANRQKGV